MREEIAKWYFMLSSWDGVDPRLKAWCYKRADDLLGILRSKIEAVDNPYSGRRGGKEPESAFEDWRREVLGLFKGET